MQDRQVATGDISQSSVVDAIHATHAAFDIWPARPDQMIEARDFAAAMIGDKIVSPQTLSWVHEHTGASLFLAREDGRLTGVWAAVLLSAEGLRACHADRFDALDPDPAHVAAWGKAPAGLYAWGIAGATRDTIKRLLAAGDAVDGVALAHLPCFTRPTTEAGRRLAIERKNFQPVAGSTTGLVWVGPRNQLASVAA